MSTWSISQMSQTWQKRYTKMSQTWRNKILHQRNPDERIFYIWCEFWCTEIWSPCFSEWPWILNYSKWILVVVEIQTQIIPTIVLSSNLLLKELLNIFTVSKVKKRKYTRHWSNSKSQILKKKRKISFDHWISWY